MAPVTRIVNWISSPIWAIRLLKLALTWTSSARSRGRQVKKRKKNMARDRFISLEIKKHHNITSNKELNNFRLAEKAAASLSSASGFGSFARSVRPSPSKKEGASSEKR